MIRQILNLLYEWGRLKNIHRSGWERVGIENPESVADHSLRAAQIGYILAKMEKYKYPERIVSMLVFHEIGETRIGDMDHVARKYLPKVNEKQAVSDQLHDIYPELIEWWEKVEYGKGTDGAIAKDADLLEGAVTAKEYQEKGYTTIYNWRDEDDLKTESAKKLFRALQDVRSDEWWIAVLFES